MNIKRFVGGMLEANCYIVSSEGKCMIVDPGYNPKRILRYLGEKGLEPECIVLTHHHSDHSGGAEKIAKETGCAILIHRLDADMYGGRIDGFLVGDRGSSSPDNNRSGSSTDDTVQGTDSTNHSDISTLRIGAETFTVHHTPGHTRGGICLYSKKHRVCFTGDTLFNVDIGRTDLEDGNGKEMAASMRKLSSLLQNDITIYPGHGDPATMKSVRKINAEFNALI